MAILSKSFEEVFLSTHHLPRKSIPYHIESKLRDLDKVAGVLLVMGAVGRQTGPAEIADILEKHPQTIKKRLDKLVKMGFVKRGSLHSGYVLTGAGAQMLLPLFQLEGGEIDHEKLETMKKTQFALTATTTKESFKDQIIESQIVEVENQTAKISHFRKPTKSEIILAAIREMNDHQKEQYKWFRAFSIGRSTAHELATMGLRNQYLKAILAQCADQGLTVNLIVHRIREVDLLGDILENEYAPRFENFKNKLLARSPNLMADIENEINPNGGNAHE